MLAAAVLAALAATASTASPLPLQQLVFGSLPDIPHAPWNPLDHMSGIAPYHDAPGADLNPPQGCKVAAAAFLIRHSSIYANDDEWDEYMKPFVERVEAAQRKGITTRSSSPLSFLDTWSSPINDDNLEQLTEPGRADAHSFGERFRKLYDPLLPPKDLGRKQKKGKKGKKGRKGGEDEPEVPWKAWTASSSRDVETAQAWIKGAFPHWQEGKNGEGDGKYVSLVKVPNKDPDWSVSLTPHKICNAFSKEPGQAERQEWLEHYGPPVLERLNRAAPGYDFVLKDVIAAQMLCGYESVINKDRSSAFCSPEVFTQDEFKAFGHWNDLWYDKFVGYGSPVAPYLGVPWLNVSMHNLVSAYEPPHPHLAPPSPSSRLDAFLSRFSPFSKNRLPPPSAPPNATHTQLLFPYFSHREEPPLALVALGLWNATNLPTDHVPSKRIWNTSHLLPFLGHVALERLSCQDGENSGYDWIRVLVNGAPQELPDCHEGPGGTCRMDRFEEFVKRRVEEYQDFEGACTKPSLAGVHIKQRKGQAKAASKFEPLVFRDAIVKHLSACSPNDYDSVTQKLDALATQLDYRRYAEQLFQILLVGAVLAPGGSFVEDGGVGRCAFSIATTGGDADKADVKELKKAVGVFERLVRRYKYLQHDFEESVLKQVLGYIGKFSPVEQERLAVSAALFNQAGLAPISVIGAVRTAHLVKDGTAQTALLNFLKTYPATGEPIDPVLTALRKAGLSDLDAFFVPGKRTAAEVTAALRSSKLNSTADWFVKLKSAGVRDEVNKKVKSLLADHADPEEISAALEPIAARSVPSLLTEGDFISIVFLALMRIDLNADPNAVVDEAVKQVNEYGSVLEPFAAKATSEVALINTVQVWVHENPKLVPAFLRILKTLVGADVISSGPLSYWYNKGSKPQGREALLAKAAPLVKFLEEQEDEESDEE